MAAVRRHAHLLRAPRARAAGEHAGRAGALPGAAFQDVQQEHGRR